MPTLIGFVECPDTKRLREVMDCYSCGQSYQIMTDRVECADKDNPFKNRFVEVVHGDNVE